MNIDKLKAKYPLFYFSPVGNNLWSVCFYAENSMGTYVQLPDPSERALETLDHYYRVATVKQVYLQMFPNLYISFNDKTLKPDAIWLLREGRDAEAIRCDDFSDAHLAQLNKQAGIALQPDMFWCTGHGRPELKSDYGYFHFAAKYCQQWGIEHPVEYQSAINQNYE